MLSNLGITTRNFSFEPTQTFFWKVRAIQKCCQNNYSRRCHLQPILGRYSNLGSRVILSTPFSVCFAIICSSVGTKLTWKRPPPPPRSGRKGASPPPAVREEGGFRAAHTRTVLIREYPRVINHAFVDSFTDRQISDTLRLS